MTITTLILSVAKQVGISGQLLLAVCTTESNLNPNAYVYEDGNSPSIGLCQMKKSTARMFNASVTEKDLLDPKKNVYYSALYLKYQQKRYGDSWVKMVASFNSGSYNASRIPGCPRNLRYVRMVQSKLSPEYRYKMECRK